LNETGVRILIDLVVSNYENITNKVINGDELFETCKNFNYSVDELLSTEVFQSMVRQDSDPLLYKLISNTVICDILEVHKVASSPVVVDWFTRLLEGYLTPEQIITTCKSKVENNSNKIMQYRIEIGKSIYTDASNGKFNEDDLDTMLKILNNITEQIPTNKVMEYVGKYLILLSMSEEPIILKSELFNLLNETFRNKMFPK